MRPWASMSMFVGLLNSGDLAQRVTSKPSGTESMLTGISSGVGAATAAVGAAGVAGAGAWARSGEAGTESAVARSHVLRRKRGAGATGGRIQIREQPLRDLASASKTGALRSSLGGSNDPSGKAASEPRSSGVMRAKWNPDKAGARWCVRRAVRSSVRHRPVWAGGRSAYFFLPKAFFGGGTIITGHLALRRT